MLRLRSCVLAGGGRASLLRAATGVNSRWASSTPRRSAPEGSGEEKPGQAAKNKTRRGPAKGLSDSGGGGGRGGDNRVGQGQGRGEEKETKVKKARSTKPKEDLEVHTVSAPSLKLQPIPQGPLKVPRLSYHLDRTLFKPGVYPLQDPRSRVYNFDPYLTTIMPIEEFDFTALKAFVSSSEDPQLIQLAAKHNKSTAGRRRA
ncbi:unnamed protein product [Parascedosporium putredinis]|uniref:Uncharacterized protein n=1 Tax=Parascedosporium putredinis TaxID=1442378 RepID=A0A9P1M8K8_9PEZI|nr:unnamed protein product [Parascedosporium putredinis]CAI7992910.1 unnamed protein product [Parascedosporium putredinis]